MSDHESVQPGQDDAALTPELAQLDALLLAEGQRWRRTEPSTTRLERHMRALVQAGGPGPRNEDSMLTNRTAPHDTPTPRPLPTRPPSRYRGSLALVATILLIALATSVFAILKNGATGTGGHRNASVTPTPAIVRLPAIQPANLNLPLARDEYLQGISFSSALDGWAVGGMIVPEQINAPSVTTRAVLIHYHNGVWSLSSDFIANISLDDVSMLSENDGWAVGQVDISSSATSPADYYTGAVLLHFTGGHWRDVSTPALATLHPNTIHMFNPDAGYITGVVNVPSTTAPGSVDQHVAVAIYQNGAWKLISTPFSFPDSQVVMVSASEGWASTVKGLPISSGVNNQQTTIYHYLNGVWSPNHTFPGWGASLSAQSPDDVWLIATQCANCDQTAQRLETAQRVEQYNGKTWIRITTPDLAAIPPTPGAGPGRLIQRWIMDGGASGVWAVYVVQFTQQSDASSEETTAAWLRTTDGWRLMSQPVAGGAVVALVADHSGGTWAIERSASGAPQTTTILYCMSILKNGWMVYGHN